MKSTISFAAFTLYQIFLLGSVQGQEVDLAGRGTSWDPNALIYTSDLETRAPGGSATYCVPDLGITKQTLKTFVNKKAAGDFYVYSSVLTFANNNAIDAFKDSKNVVQNTQVAGLAKDGYMQMMEKAAGSNKKKTPAVMTAMFIEKQIYLSSSIKGLGEAKSLIWNTGAKTFKEGLPAAVQECMEMCQDDFLSRGGPESENKHRRRGGCGECLALVKYFVANPGKTQCKGSLFVTVTEQDGKMIVFSPCGTRAAQKEIEEGKKPTEAWGCQLVTKICGADTISDESTEMLDYAIGKMTVNGVVETDAEYKKSIRYHTQSHVPIPEALYVF